MVDFGTSEDARLAHYFWVSTRALLVSAGISGSYLLWKAVVEFRAGILLQKFESGEREE